MTPLAGIIRIFVTTFLSMVRDEPFDLHRDMKVFVEHVSRVQPRSLIMVLVQRPTLPGVVLMRVEPELFVLIVHREGHLSFWLSWTVVLDFTDRSDSSSSTIRTRTEIILPSHRNRYRVA